MKTTLLTFADPNYEHRRGTTLSFNGKMVDKIWSATPADLDYKFKEENNFILSQPRGYGYWLWKPYLILKYMENICEENEMLIYCDAGDWFSESLLNKVKAEIKDCFFIWGGFLNYKYTKKDCFVLTGCDEEKYWNSGMTYAAVCFWKKTETTMKFLNEWFNYCKNPNVITDCPNIHGNNIQGFIDHRHDQSVLSVLSIKHNMLRKEQISDNPWDII
jgi:hypothetical protein